MKSKEQIINDSIKLETPPKDYNLLEIHCFLALKQLLIMFYNKQISQKNATIVKNHILADYDKRFKEYDFQLGVNREHINHIRNTEMKRIKLRKMLNEGIKTEEKLYEALNLSIEILSIVFREEFLNEKTNNM